jgi:hypothetical protein
MGWRERWFTQHTITDVALFLIMFAMGFWSGSSSDAYTIGTQCERHGKFEVKEAVFHCKRVQ